MVKKYGLGLLNPVTPKNKKYLSLHQASAELIQAVMGVGEFYKNNNILALREETCNKQKNQDDTNDTKLKGLVRYLDITNHRLILYTKNTGAWMNVRGTTVTGTVFPVMEFCDFL